MSTRPRAMRGPDRPHHPEYKQEFDEDPARILNFGVQQACDRIAGIHDLNRLQAYLAVEVEDFGPRKAVIAAINRRKAEIQDGGDR